MIAVSLCRHCPAITFHTILNHTDYLQRPNGLTAVLICLCPHSWSFYRAPLCEFSFRITNPTAEGWASQELNVDICVCGVFAWQAFSASA